MDYGTVSTTVLLAACDTRCCMDIRIVNDTQDETFAITLERTPGLHDRITLDPVDYNWIITIVDDNGMILEHPSNENTTIL